MNEPVPVIAQRVNSPVPPGAMIELNVDLVHEGKFRKRLDAMIRRAVRELIEYEVATGTKTAKAQVTAKIAISHVKDSTEHYHVKTNVTISTPSPTEGSFVKGVAGRLLVQPVGSSDFNPDQQVLFDSRGRAIGGTDPETGEVVEQDKVPAVAGRIGQQS